MTAEELLVRIQTEMKAVLHENLVGIYLHGSLAFGCFHPAVSDIDFIVVVREPLVHEVKKELLQAVLKLDAFAPAKGLEMSVVQLDHCRHFVYPTPYEFHYSRAHTAWALRDADDYCLRMQGDDPDLAAHFTVIHAVGVTLCGEPIEQVFAPVPAADYLASIRYDVENALSDIHQHPVYVILNLCRVAAFLSEGKVMSKQTGGEWGLAHLPEEFHPLIEGALNDYLGLSAYHAQEPEETDFATWMLDRIFDKEPSKKLFECLH